VTVRLDAGGRVVGPPRVTQRSGNPWYDESVVRAIQKASPLPPPPEAGEWPFEFTPPGSAG
jgi:TonB family protein